MELLKQTRFEQVPVTVALQIAKEEAKRGKAKIAKKIEKQGRGTELSRYDIFEMLQGGDVLWYKEASDVKEARKLAQEKAAKTKNSFIILDQKTQTRTFVHATGIQQETPKSSVSLRDSSHSNRDPRQKEKGGNLAASLTDLKLIKVLSSTQVP